jgi:hypothetical protein
MNPTSPSKPPYSPPSGAQTLSLILLAVLGCLSVIGGVFTALAATDCVGDTRCAITERVGFDLPLLIFGLSLAAAAVAAGTRNRGTRERALRWGWLQFLLLWLLVFIVVVATRPTGYSGFPAPAAS